MALDGRLTYRVKCQARETLSQTRSKRKGPEARQRDCPWTSTCASIHVRARTHTRKTLEYLGVS